MTSLTRYNVVIDTNVVISGLIFGGKPKQIMDRVRANELQMCISPELEQEILRKFHSITSISELHILLQVILEKHCKKIIPESITRVSRDPKDDMLLALALAGKAKYLITGDKDLLILKKFGDTLVVTPRQFLRSFH